MTGFPSIGGLSVSSNATEVFEFPRIGATTVAPPPGPPPLLLDTFTAANGTNPTLRDIDTRPASSARWESAAIGPPLNVDGQIIGNRLTFDSAVDPGDEEGNVSLRYRSSPPGDPIVSEYPLLLVIRSNIVDADGFGSMASLALTDGAATLLRCELSSTGWARAYASGNSDFYSSDDHYLGIGVHTVGLYVTQTSVVLYADGAELEAFDTTYDFATGLTRAVLQLLAATVSDGYGVEQVAIYEGITLEEAATLTESPPGSSPSVPTSMTAVFTYEVYVSSRSAPYFYAPLGGNVVDVSLSVQGTTVYSLPGFGAAVTVPDSPQTWDYVVHTTRALDVSNDDIVSELTGATPGAGFVENAGPVYFDADFTPQDGMTITYAGAAGSGSRTATLTGSSPVALSGLQVPAHILSGAGAVTTMTFSLSA